MSAERKSNFKKPLLVIILILLIGIGFLVYYFPFFQKSVAVLSPELREEVNILLIGVNDQVQDSEDDGEIDSTNIFEVEADAVVLARLEAEAPRVTFTNVPSRIEREGTLVKEMSVEEIRGKVSGMVGAEPSYYFILSYEGFKNTINQLNGVEVTLEEPLQIPDLNLYLEEGSNLLSGKEALNYVRWYNPGENEIERIKRQQDVMSAAVRKIFRANTLIDFTSLYNTLVESYHSVETDLDRELVVELIEFFRKRDYIDIEYEIYGADRMGE